ESFLDALQRALDGGTGLGRRPVTGFLQRSLSLIGQAVGLVAGLGQVAQSTVLNRIRRGLTNHALHLVLVEVGGSSDGHMLLLSGGHVLSRDVNDAVDVDVEGDLDLRHTAWRRRYAIEPELAQRTVVARHLTLALQ